MLKQLDFSLELSEGVDVYRCKKCSTVLASQNNVLLHEAGAGQTAFEWNKRSFIGSAFFGDSVDSGNSGSDKKKKAPVESCSSVFVEPMNWIPGLAEGQLEGQIACHKCDAKLGHFNWVGTQCSCGCWVAPAFVLHKSKVDRMKR